MRNSSKETYLKFILYLVVIVLINVAGLTLFFRADLTKDDVYSLSDASITAVSNLSDPLTVKVFFSKNLPAPHNNTERYLRDLLEEFAAKGGKKVNYAFYDVTPEEGTMTATADENRNMARDYGIQPVQLQVLENDELKLKNAFMGLVIIHGDLIEKLNPISTTQGLEYKLTTAIQKMNRKVSALKMLDEKVKITVYLSSSLNLVAPLINLKDLPKLGPAIEKSIEKLNRKSLDIFEFKKVDVNSREQMETLGKEYDVIALSWPAVPQKNIAAGFGMAGIVIEYKDKTHTIPLISSVEVPIFGTTYQMADPDVLEEEINAVVEKMIGINTQMAFLTGFGSHSLVPDQMAMMQGRPGGGMTTLNRLLAKQYTVKPVDLSDFPIPEGANCLFIARPTQEFTDYELFQIDQALMKGTNIIFITDAFEEAAPRRGMMGGMPQFKPIDTGLEKMMAHYGVNIKHAYVMDKQAYIHRAQNPPSEQALYFIPHIKEGSINNDPAFMDNIKELYAMRVAPLELVKENIDPQKVTATRLLSSSDESWLMEGRIMLNPQMIAVPRDDKAFKSYELAYLLSGTFTSYFKGKPIPAKPADPEASEEGAANGQVQGPGDTPAPDIQAQNTRLDSSQPAKIFILPSSQMIQDTMLDPSGMTTNTTFILNMIDHLNGNDPIAQLRSKQQQYNPIQETSLFNRGLIKALNIIALPVLVILFGVGVLIKRTARKKKIATRFAG